MFAWSEKATNNWISNFVHDVCIAHLSLCMVWHLSNNLTCCTGSRAHLPLVEVCALVDKQCTLYNVKYDTVQAVVHIHLWLDTHTRTPISHRPPQFSPTVPHFSCRSLCCHQVQVTQSSYLRLFFCLLEAMDTQGGSGHIVNRRCLPNIRL